MQTYKLEDGEVALIRDALHVAEKAYRGRANRELNSQIREIHNGTASLFAALYAKFVNPLK